MQRTSRRHCGLVPAGLCLLALCLVLSGPTLAAALSGSPFEGDDGNLEVDVALDWASFVGSPMLAIGPDEPSGQSDDSLSGKEDEPDPEIVYGSIPNNKSDLLRFYAVHHPIEIGGVDQDFLYLAWVRDNTLGSANMDFEFNQSEIPSANGVTPQRTDGDLLIAFAFSSGGDRVDLEMSRWTDTGPCEESNSNPPCWAPFFPLDSIAEGAVNTVPVFDPISGETLPERTFGEAVVNLTDAGVFDHEACVSFGNIYVKSRSSSSFSSSLKDFIRPAQISVTNCATLTVRKDAVPDDEQDFTFVSSPEIHPQAILLDDDGDEGNALASVRTFQDKFEGALAIAESPVEGWDLTAVDCTGAATPVLDGSGNLTGEVLLDAVIGEAVDCTFTNTKRGRLVIDQVTFPEGDPQPFSFVLTGGPDSTTDGFVLTDAGVPYETEPIRPGVYALSQADPGEAWDLTEASCDDGSSIDAITVDPGETVTCTFVDTKRGTIVVDQVTDPAGDPQMFQFQVTGGPDAADLAFELADADPQHAIGLARPGGYAVFQIDPGEEWDLPSATCDDGSSVDAVVLNPGETVTCTFVNTKRGRILVDQVTDPSGDPQAFRFDLTGGPDSIVQAFDLLDEDPSHDTGFVRAGGYSVVQTDAGEAWDLTSATCDDGSPVDAVSLEPGETVICTFTNTKRGSLVIDQVSIPAGDPQAFHFTLAGGPDSVSQIFDLRDTDAPHDSGVVRAGTYSVFQDNPGDEWDLTSALCDDGSSVDAVSLEPGETVTCTFTNTRRGKIVVDEVTDPSGDGQSFPFSLSGGPDGVDQTFGLTDVDPPHDSGHLRPGTYSILQTDPGIEWDLTGATCDDSSPVEAVVLDPGETVNCRFTNTRRGRIVIDQVTLPAGDSQRFEFLVSGGPEGVSDSFDLADQDPPDVGPLVRPGTYAVAQTDPGPDWDLTGAVCEDGSPIDAVALEPGETVLCTFTNTKRGKILVDQVTDPGDDPQLFSFTLGGGPDAVAQAFDLAHATPLHDSGPVRPGGYAVAQADPGPVWDLTGAVCDDGSAVGEIVLDPGETVTCTFTNTKRGELIVVKDALPDDPQDFEFTLDGPEGTSGLWLDDDGAGTDDPPGGQLPSSRTLLLVPGTHTLAEIDAGPAWDLTGLVCADDSGNAAGSVNLAAGRATFEMPAGGRITCAFTNTQRARIVVEKQVVDEATASGFNPRDYAFHFDPSYAEIFWLAHGETDESEFLPSGVAYSIQEQLPRGWIVSSRCVHLDGSVDTGGSNISLTPDPGDEVECTFTNEMRIHPGSAGFWRNWNNHYNESQFLEIIVEALSGSPIYAGLFDASGEPVDGIVSHIDAIYASGGGSGPAEQPALRELTTTMINLAVSTSDDPLILGYQNNDDICHDCAIEVDRVSGARQLVEAWVPCAELGEITIGQVVELAEATWTGRMPDEWEFGPLTLGQVDILRGLFGGINQGNIVVVDPSTYPDDPGCLQIDTAQEHVWHRDADLDGHGIPDEQVVTCDDEAPHGYSPVADDCDDADGGAYPGAPQVCDGINNDCSDPSWPSVPADEQDSDGDGFAPCAGDCTDVDSTRHPAAVELCNGVDDDCNGHVDDDELGADSDRDSIPNACDNCPEVSNARQLDHDQDGVGDLCDNCPGEWNNTQSDSDFDQIGDVCDSCPLDYDPSSSDADRDAIGDVCDNCLGLPNRSQSDLDGDGEGDACDVDDGRIHLFASAEDVLEWDAEVGFELWNSYRGDLQALRAEGIYAQAPGSNFLADRNCGLPLEWMFEPTSPSWRGCAFYLVTGVTGEIESGLGADSAGNQRPNDNPCSQGGGAGETPVSGVPPQGTTDPMP